MGTRLMFCLQAVGDGHMKKNYSEGEKLHSVISQGCQLGSRGKYGSGGIPQRLHQRLASVSIVLNKLSGGVKSADTDGSSSLRAWSSKKVAHPGTVTSEEQSRKSGV